MSFDFMSMRVGPHSEDLPLPPAAFFVLFALAESDKHGYRIMQDVKTLSVGSVSIGPATLYTTTIQRLVDRGFIVEVGISAAYRDAGCIA